MEDRHCAACGKEYKKRNNEGNIVACSCAYAEIDTRDRSSVELESVQPNAKLARTTAEELFLALKNKLNNRPPVLLPINIASWAMVRGSKYFFFDRTMFIAELLGSSTPSVVLFLRPPRFGKSLLISMLSAWFDKAISSQRRSELFAGTNIQRLCDEEGFRETLKPGGYFILHLDFSRARGPDPAARLEEIVLCSIDSFWQRYRNELGDPNEEDFNRDWSCLQCMHRLLRRVQKKFENTKTSIYLLIDEYDAVANTCLMAGDDLQQPDYRKATEIFKALFAVWKSYHNMHAVSRIFITGVTRINLAGVYSGFNIEVEISFSPRYSLMCGITQSEVQDLLHKILQDETEEKKHLYILTEYYGGYHFGEGGEMVYRTGPALIYLWSLMKRAPFYPPDYGEGHLIHAICKSVEGRRQLNNIVEHVQRNIAVQVSAAPLRPILVEEYSEQSILLFFRLGILTFCPEHGCFQVPNKLTLKRLYKEVCSFYNLDKSEATRAVISMVEGDHLGALCDLLGSMFSVVYRTEADFNAHSEQDTLQMLNMVFMRVTDVRLEVKTLRENYECIDILVTVPSTPAKAILIEVQNKQARWLEVEGATTTTVATKVARISKMSINKLRAIKQSTTDLHHEGKPLQQVMEMAGDQARQHLDGIKATLPEDATVAIYVLLSVGSRRCLWQKCY